MTMRTAFLALPLLLLALVGCQPPCGASPAPIGLDPTSLVAPTAGACAPGECAPTRDDWCDELEDLCRAYDLDKSPTGGVDYCEVAHEYCAAGNPPCQSCFYVANTCQQIPHSGLCDDLAAQCDCLAEAHGLDPSCG